ncbi:hypothetical protein NQ314_021130 [Rhamnusium bicolor]|uniref:BAG domain-containing protein n=1 Tax=Rhamnusium bicolor TaxID=1586634 RepID=A0AAV8WJ85_9CUCU|nr:hypothetical protein NQ314_021130 [Rhamnusium bicolor]
MSSPVVETVRTIPLIVEHGNCNHIPVDVDEISGFPFDRDPDRDGHFRSQLDDIAKRHPEFAEHLGNFSLRSGPRRQSSGGTEDPDLHRRFERPFGGRFERFGFPFDRDDFDPEQYAQQFYQPQEEYHQQKPSSPQHQQSYQQQPSYPQQEPEYQETQQQCSQPQNAGSPPPAPERDRNNIQQSNTIDLGQKQEPVNERNQRSMSAPPTEKGQRFTSSIKIPVNQPSESENMAQTQPQQQSDAKTTERIIPIHIEGRDDPVLPKNAPSSYPQPHQTYNASPQPERIFGQRPEQYTQFLNREPRHYDTWHHKQFEPMHHAFSPEEITRQQRFPQQNVPPHYQQQQRPTPQQVPPQHTKVPPQHTKEEIPIPVQREVPQTKQQVPQQQAAPPQQPPQPKPAPQQQKPLTPIDQIQAIQKDVSALMEQVEQFAGKPRDKQYLYLDEMLTRNLLKLDNVDTQGQETIRSARKEAIKCIERAIGVLETKAAANVEPPKEEEKMEVDDKSQETPLETKEGSDCEKKDNEIQPMETELAETNVTENVEQNQKQPETTNSSEPIAPMEQKEATKASIEDKVESKPQLVEDTVEPQIENTTEVAAAVETGEGQESNLPVAEAVKKFEGSIEKEDSNDDKKDSKSEETNKADQGQEEAKIEDKKEDKKEKKKGKKKAEKKEK